MPDGPQLYLAPATSDVRLRVIGGRGAAVMLLSDRGCVAAFAVLDDDWAVEVDVSAAVPNVRAQLVDPDGDVLAVTNPVWTDEPDAPAAARALGVR